MPFKENVKLSPYHLLIFSGMQVVKIIPLEIFTEVSVFGDTGFFGKCGNVSVLFGHKDFL